jgi:hypothetical protein
MKKKSKNSTKNKNFYTPIIDFLKTSTNLTNLRKELNISKQDLNYYLRQMKKEGLILHKAKGWYEVKDSVKISTKYGKNLVKDSIRGHAYVWTIKIPHEIKEWDKRIEVLRNNNINFKLVGAKENTPRIKIMGRKVWLCNNSIRIYDKKDSSYYGRNAIKCRELAFQEFLLIVGILERKLNINLRPIDFTWSKEHYALIKNDLAINENRKGNIWRVRDETGEWLVVDDSLEKGGELENNGKKSFETNIPMQKWWNEYKEINFELTPKLITQNLNDVTKMIKQSSEIQLDSELRIKQIQSAMRGYEEVIYQMAKEIKKIKDEKN